MDPRTVSFEVPTEALEEAIALEAESGISLDEIAKEALLSYLWGVRDARRLDLDEVEPAVPLEGTEPWLDVPAPPSWLGGDAHESGFGPQRAQDRREELRDRGKGE